MSTSHAGKRLARLVRDDCGIAAVEFALVLPVLILIYLGGVELSHAITVDRKVTSAASAVGDLVAQGSADIDSAEMTNIFTAARAILNPYDTATLKVIVTSVDISDTGDKVTSSCAYHASPLAKGSPITIPAGVRIENTSLIVTEVRYEYMPTLGQIFATSIFLSDTFYMRPRQVPKVNLPC